VGAQKKNFPALRAGIRAPTFNLLPAPLFTLVFGRQLRKQLKPVIDGDSLTWGTKLKYLGCTVKSGSCEFDISPAVRLATTYASRVTTFGDSSFTDFSTVSVIIS